MKQETLEVYSKILEILKREKLKRDIYAALAYGSRIAGYAKKHSDYDLLIILDNYPSKIRYLYFKIDSVYASTLIVDKNMFVEDAKQAKYGEFIAGRLYSVYEPLVNREFIYEVDKTLKIRTSIEELCDLWCRYGELVKYLVIPIKYILFSRLKKRIKTYPHVRYSYLKTFFGEFGEINLKKALNTWITALIELQSKGYIKLINDEIVIKSLNDICRYKPGLFDYLLRGIKSYITHGRSAKVGPQIVFEELASKVIRGFEAVSLPLELSNPEILLKLKAGRFESRKITDIEAVKEIFGKKALIISKTRESMLSDVYKIVVKIDSDEYSILKKKFTYTFLFKWIFTQLWLLDIRRFTLNPSERLLNEYLASIKLKELNINTSDIYLLSWRDRALYARYITGIKLSNILLSDIDKVKKYFNIWGKLLGRIHKAGYSLGDTKPNNVIISLNGDIYIVDLEQVKKDIKSIEWDLAEALYYMLIPRIPLPRKDAVLEGCKSLLSGYLDEYGYEAVNILRRIISFRYIRPFLPLTLPNRLLMVRRLIRDLIEVADKI